MTNNHQYNAKYIHLSKKNTVLNKTQFLFKILIWYKCMARVRYSLAFVWIYSCRACTNCEQKLKQNRAELCKFTKFSKRIDNCRRILIYFTGYHDVKFRNINLNKFKFRMLYKYMLLKKKTPLIQILVIHFWYFLKEKINHWRKNCQLPYANFTFNIM